jgi:hypothetical protein
MNFILTTRESVFLNERAWHTWQTALTSSLFKDVLHDAVIEAVRAVLPPDFPDFSVQVDTCERNESATVNSGVVPSYSVFIAADASTDRVVLRSQLRALLETGTQRRRAPGVESPFARRLLTLIACHGDAAVAELQQLLPSARPRVHAEALRVLGLAQDRPSHEGRRDILQDALMSPSPFLRDAAVEALELMRDPRTIDAITRAANAETVASLRDDMHDLIRELSR